MSLGETATVYAALILHDDGISITVGFRPTLIFHTFCFAGLIWFDFDIDQLMCVPVW